MLHNKILIIDDSLVDCKIMKRVLLNANPLYDIIFNYDGENVLQQIINEKIGVVVLDLLIESKDGIEVLKEIKECEKTVDIPVIICSFIGDRETIKKTLTLV